MTLRRKWFKRLLWGILLLILLLFIGAETFLRIRYGLCDAVLMRDDPDYEYIAQPNQKRHRLGNDIFYNSLSMRSEELRQESLRILCLGDSVINGGTFTDQNHLATTLLSKRLSSDFNRDVQVLNVSAGSWGPDNCLAWINKHGLQNAQAIILVTSSHDVHDTMTFVPVVGILKYYPVRQYPLALLELLDRYLYPNWRTPHRDKAKADEAFRKEHHIETTDIPFNPGFQGLAELAKQQHIPFLIFLHSTRPELLNHDYDQDGHALITFCKQNGIELIQDQQRGAALEHLVPNDYIHCSSDGQSFIADQLYPFCQNIIRACNK